MTNEFNYIQDIFKHVEELALTKLGTYDYAGLFTMYDKNLDNLLDKNELRQLLIDCGEKFSLITEAELTFTFNIMAFFQKFLRKETFLEWIKSMMGRTEKKMIFYTQLLDIHTMSINTARDLEERSKKEADLYTALSGKDETCILTITPRVIKFIASEINQMGEVFVVKTFEKHSCVDENECKAE